MVGLCSRLPFNSCLQSYVPVFECLTGEGVAFPGAVLLVIGILLWIFIFIWCVLRGLTALTIFCHFPRQLYDFQMSDRSCCACVCGRCKCCHPSKKYAGFLGDPDFDKTEGNGKRCRAPCIPKGTHYSRKGFIIIWVLGYAVLKIYSIHSLWCVNHNILRQNSLLCNRCVNDNVHEQPRRQPVRYC